MVARVACLVVSAALAGPLPASAQPKPNDFLQGFYSSEPGCASGRQPLRDDNVTYLSADGLSAIEYDCQFLSLSATADARAFVAVSACSAPGEMTPELILVQDMTAGDGPAEQVSVQYNGPSDPTMFYRCPEQ